MSLMGKVLQISQKKTDLTNDRYYIFYTKSPSFENVIQWTEIMVGMLLTAYLRGFIYLSSRRERNERSASGVILGL